MRTPLRCRRFRERRGVGPRGWAGTLACVVLVALAAGPAIAVESPIAEDEMLVIDALMIGSDPTGSGRDQPLRAKVYVSRDAQRIDFSLLEGGHARILVREGRGWLLDEESRSATPVPARGLDWMWVDPAAPCATIRVRCTGMGARTIAGVPTQGWRYRHARGRGPEATEHGVMWVDPETGMLMSFRGRTNRQRSREFHVVRLTRGPADETLFDLPDANPPDRRNERRAP